MTALVDRLEQLHATAVAAPEGREWDGASIDFGEAMFEAWPALLTALRAAHACVTGEYEGTANEASRDLADSLSALFGEEAA